MYWILFLLPYALELLLIIHMIKNNKPFVWLWLIVFLPYLGGIVYIIMELIPDIIQGKTARNMGETVSNIVKPNKKIKDAEDLLQRQDTIANKIALADLYKENREYEKSLALYEDCLKGPYSEDFDIIFKCAVCLYLQGKKEEAAERYSKIAGKKELTERQELYVYQITDDYDKLKDIFDRDANFEVGYILSKNYKEQNDIESIKAIIKEMEYNFRTYKYLKKTENKYWYKKTRELL